MNKLLTTVEGMDEFVITPAPNSYIIALRLTPEQAKHFEGHERVAFTMEVGQRDANITRIRAVGDDNEPGAELFQDEPTPPGTYEVLESLEPRFVSAVNTFYAAVKDDLDEYYALEEIALARMESVFLGANGGEIAELLKSVLGRK